MAWTRSVKKPATRGNRRTARPAATARKPFGRPGTTGKAEGDAAVRAWMEGVKPGNRPIVVKLNALIGKAVPRVTRAIKWGMPFYGLEGRGWFAYIGSFKNYVSLGFFAGTSLDPTPPVGEGKGMRRINIHNWGEYDEKQLRSWIKQASSIKGWGTV